MIYCNKLQHVEAFVVSRWNQQTLLHMSNTISVLYKVSPPEVMLLQEMESNDCLDSISVEIITLEEKTLEEMC